VQLAARSVWHRAGWAIGEVLVPRRAGYQAFLRPGPVVQRVVLPGATCQGTEELIGDGLLRLRCQRALEQSLRWWRRRGMLDTPRGRRTTHTFRI
jgi:hypothetical protein